MTTMTRATRVLGGIHEAEDSISRGSHGRVVLVNLGKDDNRGGTGG